MRERDNIFLKRNKERIEAKYRQLEQAFPAVCMEVQQVLDGCEEKTALALKYLYTAMPYSDMGNYPAEIYLDYASHGVCLWENRIEVRELSEEMFLNYILYHRVNEEEIRPCRSFFFRQMEECLKGLSGKEKILEVNYWCAGEVTYQSTDDRTLSAMAVYERANGRCGEESVFTVNALRSVGIPARQVYAPKWSHCDDNHAWVEAWHEGTWYFMGACEPEPVFDKGWFTNASSRAMMVHSRIFDKDILQSAADTNRERVIGQEGMMAMVNQLSRYALTRDILLVVTDKFGNPIEGANVTFEVLNYSEFAPIAVSGTNDKGEVFLTTGMGSLYVQVVKDHLWGEEVIQISKESEADFKILKYEIILQNAAKKEEWISFDMIAPVDSPINTNTPTKKEEKLSLEKLDKKVESRKSKAANWHNKEAAVFLGKSDDAKERKQLLDILTVKDRTDCLSEVLEEHLQYALSYKEKYQEDIFVKYILNPRIEDEVLQKYRKDIVERFTEEEQRRFRENPKEIWKYIQTHIQSEENKEHGSLFTTPKGCLRLGIGSEKSKEILFVAIARTFGIPSRLHLIDGRMEYFEDGEFVSVLEDTEPACILRLHSFSDVVWKYFQNWSIGRKTSKGYISLKLSEQLWEAGVLTIEVPAGEYRLITSNRLPNGNIFANRLDMMLAKGDKKEIDLALREADLSDMLNHISLSEFYLKDCEGREISAGSLTKAGKHVFLWLEESKEPTEHILNELLELREDFKAFEEQIIFVMRDPKALEDPTLEKVRNALPDTKVCFMNFEDHIEKLGRRMYVDHEKLPLIIVTDGCLNGIYATSGYNVGTGEMLLRILKE
jgi:transglutaminase-like putative cysteine protease